MRSLVSFLAAFFVTACASPNTATPVTERSAFLTLVEDRTLVSTTATLKVYKDGTLAVILSESGDRIAGTWEWEDARFCRRLAAGSGVVSNQCQDVISDGQSITFSGSDGSRRYEFL